MRLTEALRGAHEARERTGLNLPVYLACGFTPLHLATFLTAYAGRAFPDRRIELHTGLYGDLAGNVQRSGAECNAVAVVIEWPDLDPRLGYRMTGGWGPKETASIAAEVTRRLEHLCARVTALSETAVVAVSLPGIGPAPVSTQPAWQLTSWDMELAQALTAFAAKLSRLPQVRLVHPAYLDLHSPPAGRFDAGAHIASDFPYTNTHAALLARTLINLLRGARPRKGLVTDLDNTLWRGVAGDDGPAGVAWTLDHGHIHGLYQQALSALADAGVLLGVASKNSPDTVEQVFARPDLRVRKEQFFPWEVHWNAKSESIGRILRSWNVAADSVVFVDDSPMELAEVKAAFPEIECLPFPSSAREIVPFLETLRELFGKETVTEEDLLRLDSLRAAAGRGQPEAEAGGEIEPFLRDAGAELQVVLPADPDDPRILELVNKTNQFNLNGRRHTLATLRELAGPPGGFLMAVSYRDRFGPLGKIAVLAGRHDGDGLHVPVWVMSCRAFSRRIEHQCLRILFERFAVSHIDLDFTPTDRNAPLRESLGAITGSEPAGSVQLSRATFESRCPTLYHSIIETST